MWTLQLGGGCMCGAGNVVTLSYIDVCVLNNTSIYQPMYGEKQPRGQST